MLLYSFIIGILIKIYDEIIDNNIEINNVLFLLIQLCIIVLGILICNADMMCLVYIFYLSIMYLLNILFKFLLDNPINTYFYIICTFICIGLFIKNINKIGTKYILLNICILVYTICESFIFSEEYSIAKLIFNCTLFIIMIYSLFYQIFITDETLFINGTCIAMGYVLTWLIFKQYITNDYVNLIDTYSYIWKKLIKIFKKLKRKKLIKLRFL